MKKLKHKFDITNRQWYMYKRPDLEERTKTRLQEMADLGMEEIGTASFGIEGVMSGLYIERVWRYDDPEWNDYMDWVRSAIEKTRLKKYELSKSPLYGYRKPTFDGEHLWCNCTQPTLTAAIADRGTAYCLRCSTPYYH